MHTPLLVRLINSRGVSFIAGVLTFPLFLLIGYYSNSSPTRAMVQVVGLSPDFCEVKKILGGRYYYSLEFSGDIDSFHDFANRIKFPGQLENATRYYHLTPDSDQRISITFNDGEILYVSDATDIR